jgi:xylan 1,4-beta-xylosidase
VQGAAGAVHDLLGRETFLLPMLWHNDWPLCCPGQGQLPVTAQAPALPLQPQVPDVDAKFAEPLDLCWRWLRTPQQTWWQLRDGRLGIRPLAAKLGDAEPVAMLLRTHQQHHAEAAVRLQFAPAVGQQAGLVIFYNDHNHVQWLRDDLGLALWHTVRGRSECLGRVALADAVVHLRVRLLGLRAQFGFRAGASWQAAGHCDISPLCAAQVGGFVGTHVGLYATGEGPALAWFSDFQYQAIG